MKKFLCILLTLTFLFSSALVLNASAASLPEDISAIYNSGKISDVDTLFKVDSGDETAYALDTLYNSSSTILWTNADCESGNVALAAGVADNYLKQMLFNKYYGGKMYQDENADYYATAIARFLYKMFYNFDATEADMENIKVTFEGTQAVQSEVFYQTIAEVSRFAELLERNWLNRQPEFYLPLVNALGLSTKDLLESDYTSGKQIGGKLIDTVIRKVIDLGVIEFAMVVFGDICANYEIKYRQAAEALLQIRINALQTGDGNLSASQEVLSSFTGVMNLLFNNLDSSRTDCYQFLTLPESRLSKATADSEILLYMITYFNINSKHANNKTLLENGFSKVCSLFQSVYTTEKDINVLTGFYYSVFLADYRTIDGQKVDTVAEFIMSFKDDYKAVIDSAPDNIMANIRNSIIAFFQKIAEIIDNWYKILTGEREFGKQ